MLKRLFDITASGLGLVMLAPVMLGVALLVKLTSPGPVFYRATRIGRYGKPFTLLKFRSMVDGADRLGPHITSVDDPRITRIGHFLRHTKLDELPQLINVLRGEMSIVGPRPEDPRYVTLYTDAQRQVLSVRPGITSLASVKYRNEEGMLAGVDVERYYVECVLPAKLAIDLEYVQHGNLWRDMLIILMTLRALFA